jgi:hypothetical protein
MIGHGPISVKRSHSTHLRFSAESYPENSSTRSVDNLWLRQGRTALLVSVQHSGISPQPDQKRRSSRLLGAAILAFVEPNQMPWFDTRTMPWTGTYGGQGKAVVVTPSAALLF